MDIKQFVAQEKLILKSKVEGLKIRPSLLIIQVNDDPASASYIKGKLKDAAEVGFNAKHLKLDESTTTVQLLSEIIKANDDPLIHGIIVQLPLPKHINEEQIKLAVIPSKDVDGFHPLTHFTPCTPGGIIDFLRANNTVFVGKNALVIGRSNIVGKPMARLLLDQNATVTVAHSKTSKEQLDKLLLDADIIIAAVGRPNFIKDQQLKKSAIIIDVGINRVDNVLVGDVYPNLDVTLQTPVPGGVGLLTRLKLIKNLWEAYNNGI